MLSNTPDMQLLVVCLHTQRSFLHVLCEKVRVYNWVSFGKCCGVWAVRMWFLVLNLKPHWLSFSSLCSTSSCAVSLWPAACNSIQTTLGLLCLTRIFCIPSRFCMGSFQCTNLQPWITVGQVVRDNNVHKYQLQSRHSSTAIGLWKHRIPSDLRS